MGIFSGRRLGFSKVSEEWTKNDFASRSLTIVFVFSFVVVVVLCS